MQTVKPFLLVVNELWKFILAGFTYRASTQLYSPLQLQGDVYYGAENPDTARIRLLLTEQYNDQDLSRPLHPSECTVFRMREIGYQVPLSAKNWLAGQWHKKLKGEPGVRIAVAPKEGSVIEFFAGEETGKLGVVSRVTSDETIVFSGLGITEPGFFDTMTLPRERWIELGAVFITFAKKSSL